MPLIWLYVGNGNISSFGPKMHFLTGVSEPVMGSVLLYYCTTVLLSSDTL